MATTRVAILEDQRMVRESVAELLAREGVQVVASCATPAEFLLALECEEVDVALLDLNLQHVPDAGLTVARELHERCPGMAVVVVTGSYDADLLQRCLQVGVSGFIDKGCAGAGVMLEAVQAAARGERLLPAGDVRDYVPAAGDGQSVNLLDRLTRREVEVLRYLSAGADNLKIAAHLGITERTVRAHVSSLYAKLGCENRAEMAVLAHALGLRTPANTASPALA
jgi:two-component system, NarL family, nitrate/nitrite response regulator NarL